MKRSIRVTIQSAYQINNNEIHIAQLINFFCRSANHSAGAAIPHLLQLHRRCIFFWMTRTECDYYYRLFHYYVGWARAHERIHRLLCRCTMHKMAQFDYNARTGSSRAGQTILFSAIILNIIFVQFCCGGAHAKCHYRSSRGACIAFVGIEHC